MKLTEADKKFITEHITPRIHEEKLRTVSNPFTGANIETTPQIATLVKMIQDFSYNDFNSYALKKWGCKQTNCISKFDRARHIVSKLDKNIYFEIID